MTSDGERLARIETKLDMFITRQDEHTDKIEAIERKINWGHGVGAAMIFLLTFWDALKNVFK